jgi:hypothetical protein
VRQRGALWSREHLPWFGICEGIAAEQLSGNMLDAIQMEDGGRVNTRPQSRRLPVGVLSSHR